MKKEKFDHDNPRNICIILTEDCNFACEYCFVNNEPKYMEWTTLKETLDWLHKSKNSKQKSQVTFFGGEPLLQWNLIVKAVNYCRERNYNFSYSITTNGYLLNNEKFKFLKENDISVLFSIDGPPKVQNTHRKFRNKEGKTSDRVVKNFRKALKLGLTRTARPTFTPDTTPYLYETYKWFVEEMGVNSIALTPVNDNFRAFDEKALAEYDKQFAKINEHYIRRIKEGKSGGLGYYKKCFQQMLAGNSMQQPCGAGRAYLGIGVTGNIYPCHRFTQWPEWSLGNINDGITDHKLRNIFYQAKKDMKGPKCQKCTTGFCAGGCYASNYSEFGTIHKTPESSCMMFDRQWQNARKVFEKLKDTPEFRKEFKDIIKKYKAVERGKLKPLHDNDQQVYQETDHSKAAVLEKINQIEKQIDRLSNFGERLKKLEEVVVPLSKILMDMEGLDND